MKFLNKLFIPAFLFVSLVSTQAFADDDGMVKVKSTRDVSATIDKLEAVLKSKGMTIFKRVTHSEAGAKVGIDIRDTELLIFGNPKVGTLLMQCSQTAAIDLPMKGLAYKDADGQVWFAYNDPQYLAKRHGAKDCPVLAKMTKALGNFAKAATQ